MANRKKLYYVSREVYATSVEKAARQKGKVYSVVLAADNLQPEFKDKKLGFNKK